MQSVDLDGRLFPFSNNVADHNVLIGKGRYTRTECYALVISDSAKKENETMRFEETVCVCVTMHDHNNGYANSVCCMLVSLYKKTSDVVYKKYRNVTSHQSNNLS